jgi:hypothetical protein
MAAKTQTRAELDAQPHQPVVEFLPPGGPSFFHGGGMARL